MAQNGKPDRNGNTFLYRINRSRLAEQCGLSALGFYFVSYFHILQKPVPDFCPDFSDPSEGVYGHRKWHNLCMFSEPDNDWVPMNQKCGFGLFLEAERKTLTELLYSL